MIWTKELKSNWKYPHSKLEKAWMPKICIWMIIWLLLNVKASGFNLDCPGTKLLFRRWFRYMFSPVVGSDNVFYSLYMLDMLLSKLTYNVWILWNNTEVFVLKVVLDLKCFRRKIFMNIYLGLLFMTKWYSFCGNYMKIYLENSISEANWAPDWTEVCGYFLCDSFW